MANLLKSESLSTGGYLGVSACRESLARAYLERSDSRSRVGARMYPRELWPTGYEVTAVVGYMPRTCGVARGIQSIRFHALESLMLIAVCLAFIFTCLLVIGMIFANNRIISKL